MASSASPLSVIALAAVLVLGDSDDVVDIDLLEHDDAVATDTAFIKDSCEQSTGRAHGQTIGD